MMQLRDEIVALAREVLERHADVELGVLFGSRARDDAREGSDVDVAIRWQRGVRPLARELALQAELERALGRTVDLVDIDAAPPLLRWRIVRDGVLVLTRDAAAWDRLRIAIAIEHDDLQENHRRALDLQRRRLLAGGTR